MYYNKFLKTYKKKKKKKRNFIPYFYNAFECSFSFAAIVYLLRFSLFTNTSYYQIKHHFYIQNLKISFSTIDIILNPLNRISN